MSLDSGSGMAKLAGWLVADVLLVLAVVGLSTIVPTHSDDTPAATPTPTPSQTKPPKPAPPSLDLKAEVLVVGTEARVVGVVRKYLSDTDQLDRRVGFVIALADDATPSNRAIALSDDAVTRLRHSMPAIFGGIAYRSYWRPGRYGEVKLELFFFRDNG